MRLTRSKTMPRREASTRRLHHELAHLNPTATAALKKD
jgi:hypothetical protein